MATYVQLLSQHSGDSRPAVLLHSATNRYLFNCSEGLQRTFLEEKVKAGKIENVFLTRLNTETAGGLPGLILTLADSGTKNLTIHGPNKLTHMIASTSSFVYREDIRVKSAEYLTEAASFKDPQLTVHPVVLLPEGYIGPSKKRKADEEEELSRKKAALEKMFLGKTNPEVTGKKRKKNPDYDRYANDRSTYAQKMLNANTPNAMCVSPEASMPDEESIAVEEPGSSEIISKESDVITPSVESLCYVCHLPTIPGKFNKEAAMKLGLRPSPKYRELTRGCSVKNDAGETIEPHQVLGAPKYGRVFILIDVPSIEYLSSLIASQILRKYHKDGGIDTRPSVIVHMLGDGVIDSPEYRGWLNLFDADVQHIFSTPSVCDDRITFRSTSFSQLKHSQLDSRIFPVPYYNNVPKMDLSTEKDLPSKIAAATPMLRFQLEPSTKLNSEEVSAPFDHVSPSSEYVTRLADLKEFLTSANSLKAEQTQSESIGAPEKLLDTSSEPEAKGKEVIITPLGTGSSHPSKYRNVTSNLVTVPGKGTMIFDAGEGTFGQMWRHFGPTSVDGRPSIDDWLRELKVVFVSHMHADHHVGIMRILSEWNKLRLRDISSPPQTGGMKMAEKLYVISPRRFWTWIENVSKIEDVGLSHLLYVECEHLLYKPRVYGPSTKNFRNNNTERKTESQELLKSLLADMNFKSLQTVDAIHCYEAYGIVIESHDDWKIVYSGDTRPAARMAEAGKDATLLIHEATFEDDMMEDAVAKRHSTTGEGIEIGKRMNASTTLLTHFSQRYPKVPVFSPGVQSVGIAFDSMSVRIGDLSKLPTFMDSFKILYGSGCEEQVEDMQTLMEESMEK